MGVKLINESSLVAIGDAIRAKNGSNSTYSPAEMATAISNISTGQTVETLPSSFLNLTGNIQELFQGVYGKKMIRYASSGQITTTNIEDITDMFANISIYGDAAYTALSHFILNFKDGSNSLSYNGYWNAARAFQNADHLEYLPTFNFNNTGFYNCQNMFQGCYQLKSVDQFMNNGLFLNNTQGIYWAMFQNCQNLRRIPHLEKLGSQISSYSSHFYNTGLQNCFKLEEALNIPVDNVPLSHANTFRSFVANNFTLSRFTFVSTAGTTGLTAQWKSFTLDLSTYVGYWSLSYNAQNEALNDNIPFVNSAETYQQYKNGVYYTHDVAYSRYNHTSAVETINSLPDCSGTGTCYIKFKGDSGSGTDGGAISNLTSAEIAVATAKGWTVQIV